jgi:hypothetical protein
MAMNDEDGIPVRLVPAERETTAASQQQQRELVALDAGQLVATQKSAETWRTGLGGLLAIVTGALFIKGKESVEAVATFLALRASAGQPEDTLTSDIGNAGGVEAYRHRLAKRAAADLRCAQLAAFGAMGLLTAAVMVTWFAETPPPKPAALIQVGHSTQRTCGESKGVDDGKLSLKVAGGSVVKVRLAAIETVAVVEDCD